MTDSLYPFQVEGVKTLVGRRRNLLADEPGLGKTIQTLAAINEWKDVKTILVVCPAAVVLVWVEEAEKWLNRDFHLKAITGRGWPDATHDFVIVNYEKLIGTRGLPLLEKLMWRKWDLVVIDEAHYLKNQKSQRGRVVLGTHHWTDKMRTRMVVGDPVVDRPVDGVVHRAKRILFTTGTPIQNHPKEIHPLLEILAPNEFGGFKFLKRYCGAHKINIGSEKNPRYVWQFDRPQNLPELSKRLRETCMVRRLKKDVMPELPEKTRQIILFPRDAFEKQIAAQKRLFGNEYFTLERAAEIMHAGGVRFKDLSNQRVTLATKKIPLVVDHIERLYEEGVYKLLVFVYHRVVGEKLTEELTRKKLKPVALSGGLGREEMAARISRFQHEADVRGAVVSIRAAGTGITLTAAQYELFAEADWNPAVLTQCEDRAHRIGQKGALMIQHLVVDGSIEADIIKQVVHKQGILEKALDS